MVQYISPDGDSFVLVGYEQVTDGNLSAYVDRLAGELRQRYQNVGNMQRESVKFRGRQAITMAFEYDQGSRQKLESLSFMIGDAVQYLVFSAPAAEADRATFRALLDSIALAASHEPDSAKATANSRTRRSDARQESQPEDSRGLWAANTRDEPEPDTRRQQPALDWDTLSAQVVPGLLGRTGEAALMTQLSEVSCRIDISTRSDFAPPFQGTLRYAWRDADNNGILAREEVQVRAEPGASDDAAAQIEQFRTLFETQALGNLWNTFLLNKLRTTRKNDGGYEITIEPGSRESALRAMGVSEMRVGVSEDFRIRTMRVKTIQGPESSSEAKDRKIGDQWFAAGYLRQMKLPNNISVTEDATTEHTLVDGIPLTSKITVNIKADMPEGQSAGSLKQEFSLSDWKVVKRPQPLGAAQIIAMRLLQPADGGKQSRPIEREAAADSGKAASSTRPAPALRTPDAAAPAVSTEKSRTKVSAIEKYVSPHGYFSIYKPKGWIVKEETRLGYLIITVTDPTGAYQAQMISGLNTFGNDLAGIIRAATERVRGQFPDYQFRSAMGTPDGKKIVFDTAYTDHSRGHRSGRCWVSADTDSFVFSSCEAPAGEFQQSKGLLLTILANIQIFRDTIPTGSKVAPLTTHRLADGSASFSIPQGWTVQEFGTGCFLATDPTGRCSFIVANVEIITPQLGVNVPNVPVLPYLAPHTGFERLTTQAGLLSDLDFLEVIPRNDIARLIGQVYTAGSVTVEEFLYTAASKNGRCKGYTLGISWGSRLGYNWRLSHFTVGAPASEFDALAPTLAAMMQSYKINDDFARRYIAQGMARLRQMQQETARIIAKNASDIRNMMQAAYDERQRSQDYIDYLRTNYIRGQSDWVSNMEGGTLYHSDSWGTKNTATGEFWGGQPYNYVNFEGQNPKYNEQMTEINNRQLFDQVFGRTH